MNGYSVDLTGLDELTDRMQHFQQRLTEVRDDVEHRVAAAHLAWTGDAAVAHAAAHKSWTAAAAQTQEALAALRAIAATAHANYLAAAAANQRMWAR